MGSDYCLGIGVGGSNGVATAHHGYINGNFTTTAVDIGLSLATLGHDPSSIVVYDVKIWDCISCVRVGPISDVDVVLENMTLHKNEGGFATPVVYIDQAITMRNVVMTGVANQLCVTTGVNYQPGVFVNCAAQDGTITSELGGGTDCIENIVPADEFQSLDDTNSKFLFLIEGTKAAFADYNPSHGPKPLDVQFGASVEYSPAESVLAQGGTEPTYAGDEDIAGTPRPNEDGTYAIGCHEQIYNPLYSRDQ